MPTDEGHIEKTCRAGIGERVMSRSVSEPTIEDLVLRQHECVAPLPSHAPSAPRRSPAWCAFEADLRRGLKQLKGAALVRIRDGKRPLKLSVNAVLRAAKRGRTQFYAAHRDFEARVTRADLAAKRLYKRVSGRTAPAPSVSQLTEQLRKARAKIKALERSSCSREVSSFISAFACRRHDALITLNNQLTQRVEELEREKIHLSLRLAAAHSLLVQASNSLRSNSPDGTAGDFVSGP